MTSTRQPSAALSSCSSNSDFLLIDAAPTADDCVVTKLNRRAFIQDIITKSFPSPPTSNNKVGVVATGGTGPTTDRHLVVAAVPHEVLEEEEETLCLDSDLGDIGRSPQKAAIDRNERVVISSTSSSSARRLHMQQQQHQLRSRLSALLGGGLAPATSGEDEEGSNDDEFSNGSSSPSFPFDASVARLISSDVWPRVYHQFELDVRRQDFLIETEKFTDAAEAYRSVRQMMHAFLLQKLLRDKQRAAAQKQKRSGSLTAKAWSLLSPMVGRTLDRWRGLDKAPHAVTEAVDGGHDDVYSEELIEAAERMARLVILLSQQSVMGLPFEELYKRYLVHVDRVLHLDSDAARNGAMFVQLTSAPATSTSSASSDLGGSAASVASSFASVSYPTAVAPSPQQHQQQQRNGATTASAPPLPPPSLFEWPQGGRRGHSNHRYTAPMLRIHKRFRVFEVVDDDDRKRGTSDADGATHTHFTIDTDIIIDLFAPENVPIVMTWTIEQPSPRRVSTRTPMNHARNATVDKPSSDDGDRHAAERLNDQDCLTFVPHHRSFSGTDVDGSTLPPPTDSAEGATSNNNNSSPQPLQGRRCECLGASYGFHRPQCHVATAAQSRQHTN